MAEKVIILHEDEACAAYSAIVHHLDTYDWDLNDESDQSSVMFLIALKQKLTKYLDEGEGKDVREV